MFICKNWYLTLCDADNADYLVRLLVQSKNQKKEKKEKRITQKNKYHSTIYQTWALQANIMRDQLSLQRSSHGTLSKYILMCAFATTFRS